MVDAATGGRAVFGRAIEKLNLGIPQGSFEFVNFDSVDISRLDEENVSNAITGSEGMDRGTPGDIKFQNKLKYAMTPSRVLFDLVAMFGKPASVTAVGGGALTGGAVTAPGSTGYTTGQVVTVTDSTGHGAIVHVVASGGAVTGLTIVDPGYGYTSPTLDLTGIGDGSATATISVTAAAAWLVKIRPSSLNEIRAASLYLAEGGSYSASMQTGRRATDLTVTDGANKRAEVQITYSDPTGDTIAGFGVGKIGNDTFVGDLGLRIGTRGRRPYDSNFDAEKSLYLKVTDANSDAVTFVTAYATKTGQTDGSNWPSPSYGEATFVVPVSDYGTAVDETGNMIGLFGENFEKFEVTLGSDLTSFTVNDEFEIPAVMPTLAKSVVPESRLSAFHLVRKLGGSTEIRIDKGTTKIDRPYKAYRANGSRIPQSIDPSGDTKVTFSFEKRLFDRYFRAKSDAHSRFSVFDSYSVESFIPTTNANEKVEIFCPQMGVSGLKSGDISTKDVLKETATLVAEQPDVTPSAPTDFDNSLLYPVQINVTTKINPTWLD